MLLDLIRSYLPTSTTRSSMHADTNDQARTGYHSALTGERQRQRSNANYTQSGDDPYDGRKHREDVRYSGTDVRDKDRFKKDKDHENPSVNLHRPEVEARSQSSFMPEPRTEVVHPAGPVRVDSYTPVNHRNMDPSSNEALAAVAGDGMSSLSSPLHVTISHHKSSGDHGGHRDRDRGSQKRTRSSPTRESQLQDQIQTLRSELSQTRRDNQAKDEQIKGLKHRLSLAHQESGNLGSELSEAQRENQTKGEEIKELHRRLSNAQADIQNYHKQNAHSQELLDVRRRELEGAQAFLNTADSYSGEDIIEMVKTLNTEIFQSAAFITDTIEESFPKNIGQNRRNVDAWAVDEVSNWLGERPTSLLQKTVNEDQVTVVQLALQSGLNCIAEYILRLWTESSRVNKAIQEVYTNLRAQNEHSAVYGTWRSLTRKQTKRCVYHRNARFYEYMNTWVKALLTVAGWWPDSSSEAALDHIIVEKVSSILHHLAQLDKAMTEDVISMEMALYIPSMNVKFDPQGMEDADAKAGSSGSGEVLFTSELGLQKRDYAPSNGEYRNIILLKPKVYLSGAFISYSETA